MEVLCFFSPNSVGRSSEFREWDDSHSPCWLCPDKSLKEIEPLTLLYI